MWLKVIGSLIVIAASSTLGYTMARECAKRPQALRDLQGLFQILENEISFLSNILTDAFESTYKSGNSRAAVFFQSAADYLKSDMRVSAKEAWEKAVRENISQTSLNKEDGEILISFGKMLGNSDLEGQIKNIRLTVSQLEIQERKAEDDKKKNQSMYKNLGVLGGIAIVIILM